MHRPAILTLTALLCALGAPACRETRNMAASSPPVATAIVPDAPATGVPLALASARSGRVSNVRYALDLTVPDDVAKPVTGTISVRFQLADASAPLALDFAGPAASVRDLRVRGQAVEPALAHEHLLLPAAVLAAGENEISMAFDSSDLALNRHIDLLYTLFVPARARLAFPCFDQPDLKARYTLSLSIPAGWRAVANGEERSAGDEHGRRQMTFAETAPIPTYLFAFAAGRFAIESAERGGRRFRMLHRETNAETVARNKEAIFDLHARALAWLEDYTGIPYPFGKFDFALIPAFQFSGMEHPGAIFYNAASLLLDPSATQNQQLGRASLIAHETAHMWFGDLVTMKWFEDVWMKEVFASFMAAKIVNPSFPAINHPLRFLYAHYPTAYEVDRTPGTNPIRQRLDNLNEAGSLYGAIIYQKAPIVMRQLEMIASPPGLRHGLREYLKRFAYGNASWPDLIDILDRRVPEDLAAWSRAWVEEAGRPIVTVEVAADGRTIALRQKDPRTAAGLQWTQRLEVVRGFGNSSVAVVDHVLGSDRATVAESQGGERPRTTGRAPLYVLPTGGGLGYGDFILDPASRAYLTTHLAEVPDALTRGAALVTLWEEMLGGRIEADAMFEALVAALPRESNELTVQRMLTYLEQAFWTFLSADARERRVGALEAMLAAGLARATTSSEKSAWFNTLRDVARTPATLARLERIWRKTERVPGLTLAEPDYITLALELAVRGGERWREILVQQQAQIENPDRKAQFMFVGPALSADPAERAAFFATLGDVKNRGREAWVLQALGYLHHPLRAAESERFIPASLDLLLEIQRTGDIFFPKRWLDAILGGHSSASAAAMVRTFVAGLPPDYPPRLRRIVLSSADTLFRASRSTGQR